MIHCMIAMMGELHQCIAACLKAEVFENGKWKPVNLNHCVCFVGEYVFDSNQERALVINVESLNAICSSIIHGSKYTGLRWSRELVLKQPFKNDKRVTELGLLELAAEMMDW